MTTTTSSGSWHVDGHGSRATAARGTWEMKCTNYCLRALEQCTEVHKRLGGFRLSVLSVRRRKCPEVKPQTSPVTGRGAWGALTHSNQWDSDMWGWSRKTRTWACSNEKQKKQLKVYFGGKNLTGLKLSEVVVMFSLNTSCEQTSSLRKPAERGSWHLFTNSWAELFSSYWYILDFIN